MVIGGDQVDLAGPILVADVATLRMPAAHEVDYEHLAAAFGRLALNPEDSVAEVESKVIPRVFGNRLENFNAQLRRLQRDRQLGDVALFVGSEHERMFAHASAPLARRRSRMCDERGVVSYAARFCDSPGS
ncbi:MAG TPA: hypothetical protein VFN72_03285 [Solirubrobacterales bacterium]|nr:hypothetical protein [Solirubrobacterales bacterium]